MFKDTEPYENKMLTEFSVQIKVASKTRTMNNIFASIKRILNCFWSFICNYNTAVIQPIIKEIVSSVSSLLVL